MKTMALSLMAVLYMCSCHAQDNKKSSSARENQPAKPLPKESWSVNKETDEYGNITRYDSTYTWSYSNTEGDSVSMDVDSVMRSFNGYFSQHFPSMWEPSFMNPIWNDSLFHRDFFMDDYFQKRWEQDFFDMDELIQRMDSLRQRFFMETYPGSIAPPENGKENTRKM